MIIAQISDPHVGMPGRVVFGSIDTAACLARCVENLLKLPVRPDVVVATGDLVNNGSDGEYRLLRELLAPLPLPVYLMPGNHDERGELRAAFNDHAYLPAQGSLHYRVLTDPLQLIMLDTVIPGAEGGALDDRQMTWLESTLAAAPGRPTILFMHHPPIATGIGYMDRIGLAGDDAASFGALVARYSNVEHISCGHVHRAVSTHWRGTTVGICPSTAFQYIDDFRADAKAVRTTEQPAYQLHYWNGEQLVTHTHQITTEGR